MATAAEWAIGYARQAAADFETFESMQKLSVLQCHNPPFAEQTYILQRII
jgi:hypothetical protein